MTIQEALDIVIQLAQQNVIEEEDDKEEYERQNLALDKVIELQQRLAV